VTSKRVARAFQHQLSFLLYLMLQSCAKVHVILTYVLSCCVLTVTERINECNSRLIRPLATSQWTVMRGASGSNRGTGIVWQPVYGFGHLQTDCPLPSSGISAEILRCYECGITFTFIIYSPHTLWECDHLPLQDLQLIVIYLISLFGYPSSRTASSLFSQMTDACV